jgi:UDP-hydrolysing UDP-N-acetyl-D-glucosamine 2-epimerase
MRKQNVTVLTTARSEYYQLRPILRRLQRSERLGLQLLVSGSHLSAQYGKSERDIAADGFPVCERLSILVDDDSRIGAASTASLCVQAVAGALHRNQADLLLLAGDRYEILAAALAATCVDVPIAHLHGGERTDGAMDELCRHAITKLSVLHFASTEVYRARIIQMGEAPERVFAVGAPLLDEILATEILSESQLVERLGITLQRPVGLIAYHPATREQQDSGETTRLILQTAAERCQTVIITAPNQDPGREAIWMEMRKFAEGSSRAALFENLGSRVFLSVMACADFMIGNSSAGVHEAASFRLPIVNVGTRQAGRLRPRNVIDCELSEASIRRAVELALSDGFRSGLVDLVNPYGDGRAGERIVACLEELVPFRGTLGRKAFRDGPEVQAALAEWAGADARQLAPR